MQTLAEFYSFDGLDAELSKPALRSKRIEREMAILRRLLLTISITFGLAACAAIAVIAGVFSADVTDFDGVWRDQDGGFTALVPVVKRTEFCLCPTYACEHSVEAATLAHKSGWGGRSFQRFASPLDPNEGRPDYLAPKRQPKIYADYRIENCLTKDAGEALELILVPRGGDFALRIF